MSKIMPNAHEILPRLWLGNIHASTDEYFIKKYGISVVFNCTKDLPYSPNIPVKYRVPVDDNHSDVRNMTLWAPEAVLHVLREYREGKTILIHCYAGMQRSACIMAMVVMIMERIKADAAIAKIQGIRSVAFRPAVNFYESIRNFEYRMFNEIIPKIT